MSDYSALTHQLKLLDDKVYNHFVPDNKVLCNCDDNAITMYFEADVEAIMMRGFSMKEIKDEIKSAISNMNIDREALTSFIEENIHFDKIEKAVNIRKDFDSALKNVEHGYELSGALGWGFSKEDIENLAKLHKADKHKEKIEELLEDCNFHTECGDFSNGRYSRYIWEVNDDEPIAPKKGNIDIGSFDVDVQLMEDGTFDVYLSHEGSSGEHYEHVSPDRIGELLAGDIEAVAENYGTVKTPEPKKIPLDKLRKLSCPCCGKVLIALEPYETGSVLFWCDDCKIDINIEANEEVSVCKGGSGIETAAGTLIAEPYDDECAKGMKLIIKDEIIGMCDVTEDGEIRLLGYHESSDEPSICYSINR